MEKDKNFTLEEVKEIADLLQRLTPEQKELVRRKIEELKLDDEIRRMLDALSYEEKVRAYKMVISFSILPEDRQAQLLQISEQLLATQQAEEKPTDGSDRQA